MNPARSLARMTCLPSTSSAKAWVASAVSSLVSSDDTSSTRVSTGTGLKKCRPTTCSGRRVAMASFMMGMADVLDARMASSATTLSRVANTSSLSGSDSDTASSTSWRSARSAKSVVKRRRARAASASVVGELALARARASDFTIRARPASTASGSTSRTTTSSPARAHTSAMPDPISPQPTTPTRSDSPPVRGGRHANLGSTASGSMP